MSFYSWEPGIEKDECESLIEEYKDSEFSLAEVGVGVGKGAVDSETRKTNVTWIKPERLINRAIWGFVNEANDNYFRFDIKGFENVQFGKYGVGDYYDWHTDNTNIDQKKEQIRKLSLTVQLSDPDSYEGGEFQFFNGAKPEIIPNIQKQGSIVVFDCGSWHRVTPVTKGIRYSMVMWVVGSNFK